MRLPTLTIRLKEPCAREKSIVNTIVGELDAKNFAKLVDAVDLQANPRDCKVGQITDDIYESLEENSLLFEHKTKGLLLASKSCKPLERDRFKLEFSEHSVEGLLDGGHNLLATAIFMISKVCELQDESLPKVRTLDELVPVWEKYRESIEEFIDLFDFQMPIEIKHAKVEAGGEDLFYGSILDISQARNNNRELAREAKSNKAGHYDYLKQALGLEISKQVEWKTNSGGRLRVREIIALATIPLSKVKSNLPELKQISPVMIYRNKGQCLKIFEALMQNDDVTTQQGSIRSLHHSEIKSALDLTKDLPKIYDWIYEEFPIAYNKVSSRFAGISSVRVYYPDKKGFDSKKHLNKKPKTRFYQKGVKYDYPEGFITPIIWSLSELIESNGESLVWVTNPILFLEKALPELMRVYYGIIQMANYDPQGVGKSSASYNLMAELVKSNLSR